jgi:hypothetical protein
VPQLRATIGAQAANIAAESFILRLDVDLLQDGLDLVLTANRALKWPQHGNNKQIMALSAAVPNANPRQRKQIAIGK